MNRIDEILASPSASFWLKDALRKVRDRDPVDAVADAEVLAEVLRERLDSILPWNKRS